MAAEACNSLRWIKVRLSFSDRRRKILLALKNLRLPPQREVLRDLTDDEMSANRANSGSNC